MELLSKTGYLTFHEIEERLIELESESAELAMKGGMDAEAVILTLKKQYHEYLKDPSLSPINVIIRDSIEN